MFILFLWDGGSCVSQIPSAEGKCLVNCAILDFFTVHSPTHLSPLCYPPYCCFILHRPETQSQRAGWIPLVWSCGVLQRPSFGAPPLPHGLTPQVFRREFHLVSIHLIESILTQTNICSRSNVTGLQHLQGTFQIGTRHRVCPN